MVIVMRSRRSQRIDRGKLATGKLDTARALWLSRLFTASHRLSGLEVVDPLRWDCSAVARQARIPSPVSRVCVVREILIQGGGSDNDRVARCTTMARLVASTSRLFARSVGSIDDRADPG